MRSIGKIHNDYYKTDRSERLGQYFHNRYLKTPIYDKNGIDLFHQRSESLCYNTISDWLDNHSYTFTMPPRVDVEAPEEVLETLSEESEANLQGAPKELSNVVYEALLKQAQEQFKRGIITLKESPVKSDYTDLVDKMKASHDLVSKYEELLKEPENNGVEYCLDPTKKVRDLEELRKKIHTLNSDIGMCDPKLQLYLYFTTPLWEIANRRYETIVK